MLTRGHSLSGQYGTIPYDAYFRKIEQHNGYEDPMTVENYMRQQLVDYRPDAPIFESDQPRDPNDRGSGFASRERLNLRHTGFRSTESPNLPDGVFLDHEFMERDPRGVQNMPDLSKAKDHQIARASLIKYSNDADYSIPESGISPAQMVSLIRNSQQQFKDRYANFEESMDAWYNSARLIDKKRNQVAMVTRDGTIVNLADADQKNRRDYVALISDKVTGIPRWTEPDHRVKVSKYGMVKSLFDIGANKWNNNRSNSYLDHSIPVELNGQMVNKLLATLIMDIEGQRSTKQEITKGADYSDSLMNQVKESKTRINPEDIYKIMMIGMRSNSHAASAHESMTSDTNNKKIKLESDNRYIMQQSKLNHEIAETISQANKKLGQRESKDMRERIKQSAADQGIYAHVGNKKNIEKVINRLERKSKDNRYIEEEKIVQSYAGIKPSKYRDNTKTEHDINKGNSHALNNKHMNQIKRKHDLEDKTTGDIDMEELGDSPFRKKKDYGFEGRTIGEHGDIDKHESIVSMDLRMKH
jgi:hypothetical protein